MGCRFPHCVDWRNGDFFQRAVLVVTIFLFLLSMLACSNGVAELHSARALPGGGFVHPTFFLVLSIAPSQMDLPSGGSAQFTAFSGKQPTDNVVWSSSMGSISPSGIFTAPNVSADTAVRVTATDSSNSNRSAIAVVEVEAQNNGGGGGGGSTSGGGSSGGSGGGGTGSAGGGTPPTGPDNRYCQAGNIPNFGGNDGPATLPTACFYTALSATPSPGSVIAVGAGGNLQSAIDTAQCGDTIKLQAGASFLSSPAGFVLPALNCDDNHWITIRTSAPDTSLPAEGSRLTPCYSGVSSLPGRPPLSCSSTQVVTAQVVANIARHALAAFVFSPGANHYRFIGLEITRPENGSTAGLVKTNNATKVIFDRLWIHGTAQDNTETGIGLGAGSSYVALIDSYTNDFHCEAITGTCVDSHVMYGGLGDLGGGPYKIVDNFLEASAEGLLFGGGGATTTPADIEVRRNHFFKPFTWQRTNPQFVGGPNGNPFIVKNSFELKNAQRVLLEGNLMENVWGGFTQHGYQIVLTPKSQVNKITSTCPLCLVANVTVRYNELRHSGAGIAISAGLSAFGGPAQGLEYVSVHDDVLDDVNAVQYFGGGGTLGLSANPLMFWHDVTVNHITASAANWMLMVAGSKQPSQMRNLTLTNNILVVGRYQITDNGGGKDNCAYKSDPLSVFEACWNNSYKVAGNVIAGGSGNWPTDQTLTTVPQIRFVNYAEGNGGNYQLCTGSNNPATTCSGPSPYLSSGTTDGKPAGADIQAVLQAIAGVN